MQSQNDAKKLAEAKQQVYLKGFTDGVMLAGPHKGEKARSWPPCPALVEGFLKVLGSGTAPVGGSEFARQTVGPWVELHKPADACKLSR